MPGISIAIAADPCRRKRGSIGSSSCLGRDATVLDVGCGMGEPLARYLIEQGCRVVGIDSSGSMIAMCVERFPESEWLVRDMRTFELGRRFDGILAWDSFFHLVRRRPARDVSAFRRACTPRRTTDVHRWSRIRRSDRVLSRASRCITQALTLQSTSGCSSRMDSQCKLTRRRIKIAASTPSGSPGSMVPRLSITTAPLNAEARVRRVGAQPRERDPFPPPHTRLRGFERESWFPGRAG